MGINRRIHHSDAKTIQDLIYARDPLGRDNYDRMLPFFMMTTVTLTAAAESNGMRIHENGSRWMAS